MVLVNPASVAAAKTLADQGNKILAKSIGYDFIGLSSRIIVFYVVALVIAKIMELIIFSTQGISTAARLFGIPLPSTIPNSVRKLFVEGYDIGGMKIKYWDVVKIVATLMVIMEMLQYTQDMKSRGVKPLPSVLAVFVLLITANALISIPELYQMIREKNVVGV